MLLINNVKRTREERGASRDRGGRRYELTTYAHCVGRMNDNTDTATLLILILILILILLLIPIEMNGPETQDDDIRKGSGM